MAKVIGITAAISIGMTRDRRHRPLFGRLVEQPHGRGSGANDRSSPVYYTP